MFLGRFSVMNPDEQPPEVHSPLQRAIAFAAFGCLVSLALVIWVARPAIELLDVWWAELLAYAFIPILIVFTVLYRSDWRREMTVLGRLGSLTLLSGIIFGGALIALLFITILASVVYSTFVDGFTAIHY